MSTNADFCGSCTVSMPGSAVASFLKRACARNSCERRPSARELLEKNPFILKAKKKSIMKTFVEECMELINDYRQHEIDEAVKNFISTRPRFYANGIEFNEKIIFIIGTK